jgi:hypothetical protein
MQIVVFDGALSELVDLFSLVEVIEDTSEICELGSVLKTEAAFHGFAEPGQEVQDVIIDSHLFGVEQVLLFESVELDFFLCDLAL